jgi:hypothetical protein
MTLLEATSCYSVPLKGTRIRIHALHLRVLLHNNLLASWPTLRQRSDEGVARSTNQSSVIRSTNGNFTPPTRAVATNENNLFILFVMCGKCPYNLYERILRRVWTIAELHPSFPGQIYQNKCLSSLFELLSCFYGPGKVP